MERSGTMTSEINPWSQYACRRDRANQGETGATLGSTLFCLVSAVTASSSTMTSPDTPLSDCVAVAAHAHKCGGGRGRGQHASARARLSKEPLTTQAASAVCGACVCVWRVWSVCGTSCSQGNQHPFLAMRKRKSDTANRVVNTHAYTISAHSRPGSRRHSRRGTFYSPWAPCAPLRTRGAQDTSRDRRATQRGSASPLYVFWCPG